MRPTVLLIPLALSSLVAGAQSTDDQAHGAHGQVTVTKEEHCPVLSTRGPAEPAEQLVSCGKKVVLHLETPVTITNTLKALKGPYCVATYAIEYTQKDTNVGIAGVIDTKDCAAASGDYKLAVRVRTETGEGKTLEFLESWQRDDDEPVKFAEHYPIGSNVDLVSVRTEQVRCTCADAPTE